MESGQLLGNGEVRARLFHWLMFNKGWPQDEHETLPKVGKLPFGSQLETLKSFPGARLSLIEFFRTMNGRVFQYPRNRSIYHGQEPDAAVYYWLGDVTWLSKRTMKRIWTIPACHGSHWESWHFFRGVFLVGVVLSSLMVGPGLRAISPWKRGLNICLLLLFIQSVKFHWFDFICLCSCKSLACLSRFIKTTMTTPCKTPHGFSPLDFWVPTHLVVCPKSRRRLGSHGFGHYYLKDVNTNFHQEEHVSIFIMSLHRDKHVVLSWPHKIPSPG